MVIDLKRAILNPGSGTISSADGSLQYAEGLRHLTYIHSWCDSVGVSTHTINMQQYIPVHIVPKFIASGRRI